MPIWQDEPPQPHEFGGVRLLRVPPRGWTHGTITSHRLIGTYTHFSSRRTQPCSGPTCSLCAEGQPPRWHGYLSILSSSSARHLVLELTALAAQPVAEYQKRHGSLRGATIKAERAGNRPNSPVHVEVTPADTDLRTLPAEVHIRRYLATIWGIELDPSETGPKPNGRPHIRDTISTTADVSVQCSPTPHSTEDGAP